LQRRELGDKWVQGYSGGECIAKAISRQAEDTTVERVGGVLGGRGEDNRAK